ncbi:MAG TPA: hypothetical protein VGK54_15435 [Chloroflexota bacterium]|jgi:hypothetical protein
MELRERAIQELKAIVDQYAAGEASVVRAYFEQPHTSEDHVEVLVRQCGREIQTADALHKTVKMLDQLDGSVDRHEFSDLVTKIAEETTHYVLLADLAEWVAERKLSAEELHRYEVHAAPDPGLPAAKNSNVRLPEANKMLEVGRQVTAAMGYERGRACIGLSEGGGGGAFIECARLSGDEYKDRLAQAMRRILKDELRHGPEGVEAFAETWVKSESDLADATQWLRRFMSQHLRVRNEIWGYPLSPERLEAADRGDLPAVDLTVSDLMEVHSS